MPIIRISEIREMSNEQRQQRLSELKTELSKIKTLINAGGSIENPGRAKAIKKAIARIETITNEGTSSK